MTTGKFARAAKTFNQVVVQCGRVAAKREDSFHHEGRQEPSAAEPQPKKHKKDSPQRHRGRGVRSFASENSFLSVLRVSAVNSVLDRDSLDDHWKFAQAAKILKYSSTKFKSFVFCNLRVLGELRGEIEFYLSAATLRLLPHKEVGLANRKDRKGRKKSEKQSRCEGFAKDISLRSK